MTTNRTWLCFFTCLLLFEAAGSAETMSGKLSALDVQKETLTIQNQKKFFFTFNFRPSVEVFLNGQQKKISDLALGLGVTVTTTEPGMIGKIVANGTIKPNIPAAPVATPGQQVATSAGTQAPRLMGTWRNERGGTATFSEGGRFEEKMKATTFTGTWEKINDSEVLVRRSDQSQWHFVVAPDNSYVTRREHEMKWMIVR